MTKVLTITSSSKVAKFQFYTDELQMLIKRTASLDTGFGPSGVGLVVKAGAKSVTLATRPIATERALRTQRLNQALELGYQPPVQSTRNK